MSAVGLIVTIFVVVLIYIVLRYAFYSPNTLTGTQSAKTATVISASQLPTTTTGSAAANFTYSAWINIDNWNYRYGQPKVILGRMSGKSSTSSSGIEGIYGANPCPVIALGAIENSATCALACYGGLQDTGSTVSDSKKTTTSTTMISNIPLQSWVHLAIVVNNQTLDFYMNGKIVRSSLLPGPVAVDNTADLYVTPNGGFDGYIANVQYWAAPKNSQEIWDLYEKGYSSSVFGSLFSNYTVQFNITQNGMTQGTITL